MHSSSIGVAIVQICVAAVAELALYDLGKHLAGRMAGLLAAVLFLLNPDIFRWNLFVLTDALYIDFIILACWAIWKASRSSLWTKALCIIVVLFAGSIRPNGWPLPLVAVSHWISLQLKVRLTKLVLIAALFISFGYGLSRVHFSAPGIENESPLRALQNKVIVWGYPHPFEGARDSMGLGVVRNPVSTMKLAGLRVAAEFAHVRPFYSRLHNVALLLFLPAIYASAAYGFCRLRNEPLTLLIMGIVLYHTLIIAVFFCGLGRKISPVLLSPHRSGSQLGSSDLAPTSNSAPATGQVYVTRVAARRHRDGLTPREISRAINSTVD